MPEKLRTKYERKIGAYNKMCYFDAPIRKHLIDRTEGGIGKTFVSEEFGRLRKQHSLAEECNDIKINPINTIFISKSSQAHDPNQQCVAALATGMVFTVQSQP